MYAVSSAHAATLKTGLHSWNKLGFLLLDGMRFWVILLGVCGGESSTRDGR